VYHQTPVTASRVNGEPLGAPMKPRTKRILMTVALVPVSFLAAFVLVTPGFSPITAHRTRIRVERLCDSVHVGEVFDFPAFEERARTDGLHASLTPKGDLVVVMEMYWLMTTSICFVDLSNGVVTSKRAFIHAP